MDKFPNEDFASALARFAYAVSPSSVPAPVLAAAKTNVFDTLVCAAAGSSAAAVGEARELALEWGGAPQATLLGFGERVPAHHAAWVNGTMAHARDYDDTHDAAVLHAGVSVVPAALAAAELSGDATGADFLSGVIAGLETICRLGVATRISIVESGYMYTALFGHFAATVAAARVLRLSEAETVNALGIAYSQVAGNHQVTRDAALTKRMQPGFAAMSSLLSVQLSRRGVRGAQASFDGADGFLRVYLRGQCDGAVLRTGLGERFEMAQLSYKPYPCCRFNHNPISAALELREGLALDQIERVRVGLNRQAFEAVCTPPEVRRAPRTIVQAQFSVPYTVAVALIDGGVGLRHFTDAALQRADLLALAAKVEPYVDEDTERRFGRRVSPALLQIDLRGGDTRHARVALPLGHPDRPMQPADFEAKARDCFQAAARPLPDGAHLALRDQVDRLDTRPDLHGLLRTLVPVG